ncbi:hypothetical protein CEXT_537751 [Caerostris extrusa]|uniref:Secreted protein n=1 Tax=Caerostris extrusa TaxID=172846 RepID=A0AAV4NDH5_CAEEX|nr:hypothetical protein CEXT_537751 [Caerostris extrusa]
MRALITGLIQCSVYDCAESHRQINSRIPVSFRKLRLIIVISGVNFWPHIINTEKRPRGMQSRNIPFHFYDPDCNWRAFTGPQRRRTGNIHEKEKTHG